MANCPICGRRVLKSKDSFQEHWSHTKHTGFIVHLSCARLHPAIVTQLLREVDGE